MYRSIEEIHEGALEHSDKLRREAEAFRLLKKDRRGIRYKLAALLRALAAQVDPKLEPEITRKEVISY